MYNRPRSETYYEEHRYLTLDTAAHRLLERTTLSRVHDFIQFNAFVLNEVIGSSIKGKKMLINDGHFSNYQRIKQNHLTSMIASDHHKFTDVLHLNTVKNMHSGFKLCIGITGVSPQSISTDILRYMCCYAVSSR